MRLPSLVEIEINSQCNLSCSYCPNSVGERIEKGEMTSEVFSKIISDLKKYDYKGKIAFEFYNEPLLAKNINSNIKYLKAELPQVTLILYSNGLKINSLEAYQHLVKLGVDKFVITKHEQVDVFEFQKVYESLSENDKKNIILKDHSEIKKYNRAGILDNIEKIEKHLEKPCSIPSTVLTISVKGNVLSCFEDFYQKYTFTNTIEENVIETWNGERYQKFKDDLKNSRRQLYSTCSKCNRDETMEIKNKHMIDNQELEAIREVLESNSLFRYNSQKGQCDLCEEEFNLYFGTKYSHILSSGTNALVVALMALGISHGDEVIIPAYTFFATAGAVLSVGAIPVIVDIDDTLMMDPEKLDRAKSERTKAIIPVHMDGLQCDIKKICSWASENDIRVIEDVAQAFGASFLGKKLGTWGDIGCFSFNRDKIITAGEGGLVITNDTNLEKRIISSLDQAISFNPSYTEKLPTLGAFLGISTRVSEITGAMLRVQLKKTDQIILENKKRKEIFISVLSLSKFLNKKFHIISPIDKEECFSSLHIKLEEPALAAILSKKLLESGLKSLPITMRRAHCVWKWSHFLKEGMSFSRARDPYLNTASTYEVTKKDYLNALFLLPSTLRMEIDITLTEEDTHLQAQVLREIMEKCFEKL